MEILYATSFRNEQTANGLPTRIEVSTLGVTSPVTRVTNSGFYMQGISADIPTLLDPEVSFSKNYGYFSALITPAKYGTQEFPWMTSIINIFGLLFINGKTSTGVQIGTTPFIVSTVHYADTGYCDNYINGVYIDTNVINATTNCISLDGTFALTLSDTVIGQSDTLELPIKNTLVDQELAVVSNSWPYSGASLLESVDSVGGFTGYPRAESFMNDSALVFSIPESDAPLLVETAGHANATQLLVNNKVLEPKGFSARQSAILPSNNTLTVTRQPKDGYDPIIWELDPNNLALGLQTVASLSAALVHPKGLLTAHTVDGINAVDVRDSSTGARIFGSTGYYQRGFWIYNQDPNKDREWWDNFELEFWRFTPAPGAQILTRGIGIYYSILQPAPFTTPINTFIGRENIASNQKPTFIAGTGWATRAPIASGWHHFRGVYQSITPRNGIFRWYLDGKGSTPLSITWPAATLIAWFFNDTASGGDNIGFQTKTRMLQSSRYSVNLNYIEPPVLPNLSTY